MCNFLKNWAPGTRLLKNRNVLTKRTYFINGIIIINIIYAFFMDPSATATLQPLSRPVSISSSWIHLPQQHSSHSRVQCLYLRHTYQNKRSKSLCGLFHPCHLWPVALPQPMTVICDFCPEVRYQIFFCPFATTFFRGTRF